MHCTEILNNSKIIIKELKIIIYMHYTLGRYYAKIIIYRNLSINVCKTYKISYIIN